MIYFLFVPTESGRPEMAALDAVRLEDAISEAEALPFAGRTGYLFDGDRFVQEVTTADSLQDAPPLATVPRRRPPVRPVELAPRPG